MTQRAWPAWARASEIQEHLRLSGPIAISPQSWLLIGRADAIVLGQVKGQEHELAFILNSWLPIGVTLGFGMGILLGVQVLTSELVGRGEQHLSGRIFRRGMAWAVGLGLLVTLSTYLAAAPLFDFLFVQINPNDDISALLSPEDFA
ncbi:MAG: multidrug transporter, partial [Pseudomonadota bacterium]